MVTILQFKLIHGIVLFGASIVMAVLLILVIYLLGTKKEELEYEIKYDRLVFYVNNSIVSEPGKKFIQSKFEDISRYRCCNREKLQVLEQQFYKKFAGELHKMQITFKI